jgi:hypothetical protein
MDRMAAVVIAALRPVGVSVTLGLAALATLTCGPSFQAVYESDVQFEHCYGLDMSTVSADVKRSCWQAWFAGYTYGQSRDRVDYASARLTEPSTGAIAMGAVAPATSAPPAGSPLPKDAFVPPPNVSDGQGDASAVGDAGATNRSAHVLATRAPGADCADVCSQRWSTCYGSCRDGTCTACDRAYRSCMLLCYRDDPALGPSARIHR